ncbi:hypothetical protein Hanom_Chr08g00733691 [Helianthus anomalus]
MVDWFLHFYLRIIDRPVPPPHEKEKKVELYDLYVVKKGGGHKRQSITIQNLWVIIAKDLGLGDMV